MKIIIKAYFLLLVSTSAFANEFNGLYWYTENKVVVEGDRKDGMIFKANNQVSMVGGDLKPYMNCQYNVNGKGMLLLTCQLGSKIKTIKFNMAENGKYLFVDNDKDNGGYLKQ